MYRSLKTHGQTGNRLAKPPPEEPDASIAHVRVCEGPGRQRPGLLGSTSRLLTLFIIAIMMMVAAKTRAGLDYGPKYWSPTEEVMTPHIKWAKPDAQGSLKVLFIVGRVGMREVVELSQRMDIQYTVVAVGSHSAPCDFCETSNENYDPDRSRDRNALTDELLAKLDGFYDVIVLGNANWNSFPLIVQARLLKKVKDGTSLVGFVPAPNDYFTRATSKKKKLDLPVLIPYKGLPAFAKYKDATGWVNATVDYAVFGKGKILTLKGFGVPALQAFTPGPAGNVLQPKLVEHDYYLAWIGHLMRFAAGRTSMRVTGSDYVFTNRCVLTNMEYSVSGPLDKTVTCAFTFRNDDNQIVSSQEKKIKLSASGTTVRFDVPRAPAGRYFADVWVKEGEKVWAFGSSFVELTGDPAIEAVELKTDYRREDKVTGKIRVIARKTATDGLMLVLRQRDTYGRVTAQSRVDVPALQTNAAQEVSFELSGSQPLTIMQYLEVELRKGDETLDRKEKAFSISDLPPADDIRYIAWCGLQHRDDSYSDYYMFAELAKAGFDTQHTYFTEIPALYNIRHLPVDTLPTLLVDRKSNWQLELPSRMPDDHVRLPCLNDPAYRKELADGLTKKAAQTRPFSASEFSLGQECHFVNGNFELCFCPHCVIAFHRFLAKEYGTVEAMNREYGTQYKSFDEVQPITLDKAKRKNNLQPLWVDFRQHMENAWSGIFLYCAEVMRKIIPSARIGYEASDARINSYRGVDFYKLMKSMQMNAIYIDGAFMPYVVASFAQPGTLLGLGLYGGYNGTRCPEFQRYTAWWQLFRGANSYWVWTTEPQAIGCVVAPDLSIYDFFKANVAEVQEIKRGTGKLLMMAQRVDDGIAILYSASSVHVSTLTDGLPVMEKVLNALTLLFEDTGHQFGVVSYEQVANGQLKKGGYKVLWMPYVQALSRKEAGEIEAFVREGGTVVADLRPGVRDEHGKPYEGGGILDKVFGVKQMTACLIATNCDVKIDLEGCPKTLKKTACDLSIGLGTGEARASLADEKPALIFNQYGKGKALLLNFSLSAYVGVAGALEQSIVKASEESGDICDLFKAVMRQVEITEPVKVEPEIAGVRLYRFAKDGIVYLGALQELPEPPVAYEAGEAKPLTVKSGILKLYKKKHVYDVRKGKYLGYTDQIKTMIEPAKGLLFALLPYEVKGLKLNVPKRIGQGETLEYEAAIEGAEHPGLHVFHVDLVSPKGEQVSCYAANVVGENGKGKSSLPLALNEAVGKWKILVKDVATGMIAEQTFAVEERK